MIKAFGTSPCYFDGRDEGISDTKYIYLVVFAPPWTFHMT